MAGHAARCLLYCSRAMGRKLWARNDACKATGSRFPEVVLDLKKLPHSFGRDTILHDPSAPLLPSRTRLRTEMANMCVCVCACE